MPNFWLDADSIILPYRSFYSFDRVPNFWDFLVQETRKGIIASPFMVLKEIEDGCADENHPDELLLWARKQEGVLFLAPNDLVQQMNSKISDYVSNSNKYPPWEVQRFLCGADTWVIAHAKVLGGRVVTFEKAVPPNSSKAKIPDIAEQFGVDSLNLHKMLAELKARF